MIQESVSLKYEPASVTTTHFVVAQTQAAHKGSVDASLQAAVAETRGRGGVSHLLLVSTAVFFFITLRPDAKSMSLKYEPASEPLHIYVK